MLYDALTHDGLLLARDLRDVVSDPRSLQRDVEKGILFRLRRGAYIPGDIWSSSTPHQRHLHRIRAVMGMSDKPLVLAGMSAAAVWGMPVAGEWPTDVTVADMWRGGGRSEAGIRVTAAGFPSARVERVNGFRVTDLSRTAICVARLHDFAEAIGSMDWALWRKNDAAVSAADILKDLRAWNPRSGVRHVERVLEFATTLSDSYGESTARAMIHLCGFEPPRLQEEFVDSKGKMIVDFYWPGARVGAEFDGKMKYTRAQFTHGDPGEVVWREKKRQDRLHRMAVELERIITSDIEQPQLLTSLLVEAGVPTRR